MLSYTEIKPGVLILLDTEPYEVLSTSGVVKKQRQKPHNTAKLRNVTSGSVVEKTFSQADKIEEAHIEKRDVVFVYANRGEVVFSDPKNPGERFSLPEELVAAQLPYLREKDVVVAKVFNDNIFGIDIPIKVVLTVAEAPPNIRGNTSAGGNKVVTLETGLTVTTPLFIEAGDQIRVNTQTGEYVERT